MASPLSSALSPAALELLSKAEDLPDDEYALVAQEMLRQVEHKGGVRLDDHERAEVLAGMDEIARGEWVDGDELLAELEAEQSIVE